ncbi:hypothetical protein AMAG_05586 [Allomyces macrogynus ATCC 38327]|uniref:Cyclic nucleotide-binding domain-containing protein n=1 Tax=Allomyces macrogynus (strain ATCC 38327) TaxID=578462 RepID=A0A0L0SCK2_ALLM3|nr:hypothetical protein AMAG_05586 [Allomyces macrogynus ATCC 38327]|eukprot:KNE60167.1 hypothetical protein AMAG_05586 [Allomyces macrogynus ATCC 38327]
MTFLPPSLTGGGSARRPLLDASNPAAPSNLPPPPAIIESSPSNPSLADLHGGPAGARSLLGVGGALGGAPGSTVVRNGGSPLRIVSSMESPASSMASSVATSSNSVASTEFTKDPAPVPAPSAPTASSGYRPRYPSSESRDPFRRGPTRARRDRRQLEPLRARTIATWPGTPLALQHDLISASSTVPLSSVAPPNPSMYSLALSEPPPPSSHAAGGTERTTPPRDVASPTLSRRSQRSLHSQGSVLLSPTSPTAIAMGSGPTVMPAHVTKSNGSLKDAVPQPVKEANRVPLTGGQDDDSDDESVVPTPPPVPRGPSMISKFFTWLARTAQIWTDGLATANHDPNSPFWRVWDALVRLLDIYYLALIPPLLAFVCDYTLEYAYSFLGLDVVLTLSILVDLVRPRRDKYGDLVVDRRQKFQLFFSQRRNQLRFISALPLDWIVLLYHGPGDMMCSNPIYVYSDGQMASAPRTGLPNDVTLLGQRFLYYSEDIPRPLIVYAMLHSLRILHITNTVIWALKTHIPNVPQPISRLIKILGGLLVLAHVNSCLFFTMDIRLDRVRRSLNEHLVDDARAPTSFSTRYAQNFLDGLRAFFFVTRNVKLIPEILYTTCELMFASVMYGLIITNLAAIVRSYDNQAELDEMAKNRNFKRTMMRRYMVNNKFPRELQKKIVDQEEFEWVHKQGIDLDNLFQELPISLRQEAAVHLYYDLINKVPLFRAADESFKVALVERINKITVQAGFYICRAGDPGKEMYFIRSGTVHILTPDESKVIVTLKQASFFGELALLESSSRRTATAKAVVETELCVLRKDEFNQILYDHPEMVEVFRRAAAERREADAKRKAAEARDRDRAAARAERARRVSLQSTQFDDHGYCAAAVGGGGSRRSPLFASAARFASGASLPHRSAAFAVARVWWGRGGRVSHVGGYCGVGVALASGPAAAEGAAVARNSLAMSPGPSRGMLGSALFSAPGNGGGKGSGGLGLRRLSTLLQGHGGGGGGGSSVNLGKGPSADLEQGRHPPPPTSGSESPPPSPGGAADADTTRLVPPPGSGGDVLPSSGSEAEGRS